MSIPFKEIKKLIRFKTKDLNEVTFSDYEIKMAVNEVLRYLSISQALNNSDFLNKGLSFDHTKPEGFALPDDFVSLVGVRDYRGRPLEPCSSDEIPRHWQYKINSSRIFSGAHSFVMMYKAALHEVSNDDSAIELPNQFKDMLVKLAIMILRQQDGDVMQAAADEALAGLIPARRYVNGKIKMPFRIG